MGPIGGSRCPQQAAGTWGPLGYITEPGSVHPLNPARFKWASVYRPFVCLTWGLMCPGPESQALRLISAVLQSPLAGRDKEVYKR